MASYTSKAECLLDEVDRQRVANRNFATISQPLFRRLLNKPIYRHGGRLYVVQVPLNWTGRAQAEILPKAFICIARGNKSIANPWPKYGESCLQRIFCSRTAFFGRAMTRWWTLSQNELCTFPNDIPE